LKEGKAILEEKITLSVASYLKMGLNLMKIAGSLVGRIIYNLSRRVKSKGILVALTGKLDDENAWIIVSGASRLMIEKVENFKLYRKNHHHMKWSLGTITNMHSRALDLHH